MLNTYNKALVYSCLILIIGLMSVDFISPSLPYIQVDFNTSQEVMKNTVLIYMLVLGIGQLPYGFLSDQYGRKPVILVSFLISTAGIGLSAVSSTIETFYAARIITAIGCAGCPVIARAIISDISKDATQLKKSFSIFSLTSQLSPSIAPILGGGIQIITSWRISLSTLLLFNVACFVVLYKFMPETRHAAPHNMKTNKNIYSILKDHANLFTQRYFFIVSLLSALIYVYTIGFYNMLPFVLHSMHISVLVNGFINSFYACSLATGAFVLHRYMYRYSSSKLFFKLAIIFTIYFLLSTLYFYYFKVPSGNVLLVSVIVWGCTIGFLCGIIAPLTLSMCMKGFSKNKGMASSIQSSIKMFFTGVGLLLFSQINLVNMFQISLMFLILSMIIMLFWASIKNFATED